MKTFVVVVLLWFFYMTIFGDVGVILSFIRKTIMGILLIMFLIPTLKGLYSAVKGE